MSTYTIHEQVFELLTEAFEGAALDLDQTLYICESEQLISTEEDDIAEMCDEWDEITVAEFLNIAIRHRSSEYGGYRIELPEFETLSETVIAW